MTYTPQTQQQLQDCLDLLKGVLDSNLLGVYLYGSALVGGLQKYSDIDVFGVIKRATPSDEKTRLIDGLLQVSGIYREGTKRPLEVTLVEKTAINPWQYPPVCDFQYGEWLRDSFEKGVVEPPGEMPDLALIVTQVRLRSQTLWGLSPEKLLVPVPYPDFMRAMLHDLDRLAMDLESDTRNVLLTYARIWSTLTTNEICSKPEASDWAMARLPQLYQPVMERAKLICVGKEKEHWEDITGLIKLCADFMADKIREQSLLINLKDPTLSIKLAGDNGL